MIKKDLIKLYNLDSKVVYCKRCTISNQRPRISFDSKGICSACNFTDYKKNIIDWEKREKELIILCDKYRKSNGEFDVIVPCSGGKDGTFVAHQLRDKYEMNPLTVTWSPLRYTDIGFQNLQSFIDSGFYNILGSANRKITKRLTKASFELIGDPFQPFIFGQTNFPLQIAVKHKISLIMYGENGEVEYGGNMQNAKLPNRQIEDHSKMYFSNFPPEAFKDYQFRDKDLTQFLSPKLDQLLKNKTQIHFFGYYKFWDPQKNFYYAVENCNFKPNPERTEGTYSKYASLDDKFDGFHFYLAYIKFGIGRATSETAHEIRDNLISKEEGINLVKKYDGEFPKKIEPALFFGKML